MSRFSRRIASQPTITHYHADGSLSKVSRREEFATYAAQIKYHLDGVSACRGYHGKMHHVNACFSAALSRPDILARYPRFAETAMTKAQQLIQEVPPSFTRTHVILRRAIHVISHLTFDLA
jgi:hypothetical protein